jgi:beta-lactamase class A
MRTRILSTAVWIVLAATSMAQTSNWKFVRDKTEAKLKELVANTKGAAGMLALDLTSGERFAINETLLFPQGSAIKIPILMEVMKQASEGRFELTDVCWVSKHDKVGGSGVLAALGDSTSQLSVRDLAVLMIVLSDNTATNILIDLVGMKNINETLRSLGLKQTSVQRRMMDEAASRRGDENLSTPAEAVRILEILYKGEFVSESIANEILSILKIPKAGAIRAGLPESIPVAFKPGGIPGVSTEWAIVYLTGRPYALSVMENYGLEGEAAEMMKGVSRLLYEYYSRLANSSPNGTYVGPN